MTFQDKPIGIFNIDILLDKKLNQLIEPAGLSSITTAITGFMPTVRPPSSRIERAPSGSSTIRLITPNSSDVDIVIALILILPFFRMR